MLAKEQMTSPIRAVEETGAGAWYGDRFRSLQAMIGRTPLLAIDFLWRGQRRTVYAKAEYYNLTGSIKDRMALHVLREGAVTGALKKDAVVVEATSGNSGISTAAVARALGLSVRIFMPDWMSDERKRLLRALGADLVLVSAEDGGVIGAMEQCAGLATRDSDVFGPCQFSNADNWRSHYLSTGVEIAVQLRQIGEAPAVFVAGVGTGGTVMGVGRRLKEAFPGVRVHPVEPAESPTLSRGYKSGSHRIQGMTDDFIPEILKLGELDPVIPVFDGDGIVMAQKLARELGLGVGISSGVNLVAAILAQEKLRSDGAVVTVFCDDNKKYLSTDLGREEPVREDYVSRHVELIGYRAFPCLSG